MRIRFTKAAQQDLDGIFDYWAQCVGVAIAARLLDEIEEQTALLREHPFMGREREEVSAGVRSFPAGDYLIYYRKAKGWVEILHVFHGVRDQSHAWRPS